VARADAVAADRMEIVDMLRGEGVTTLRELARELNRRSIPAPRGGEWSAGQVRRILACKDFTAA
jgi:hypothetical protein